MTRLRPREAVRAVCRNCLACPNRTEELLRNCEGNFIKCVYYPYRFGRRITLQVMRKFCINNCMAQESGYAEMIRDCQVTDCGNHEFRMGTNPSYGARNPTGIGLPTLVSNIE